MKVYTESFDNNFKKGTRQSNKGNSRITTDLSNKRSSFKVSDDAIKKIIQKKKQIVKRKSILYHSV